MLRDALEQLRGDGFDAFMEIGPHAVLGASILRTVPGASSWPTQRRGSDELTTLLTAVADAYCAGAALDWSRLYPQGDPRLRAPRYPFQREPLWRETVASRADRLVEELHPLLHQRLPTALPAWRTTLNERFLPWLPDHRVAGALIFPGAGYAVAALAAAESLERGNAVENLSFQRALEPISQTLLQIDFDPRDGHLSLHSLPPGEPGPWHVHATARLPEGRTAPRPALDLAALRARCPRQVDVELLYRQLASQGLQYGPTFRCMQALAVGEDEALVTLDCQDPEAERYLLHPALLDAAFQSMLGLSLEQGRLGTYVPVTIAALRLHGRAGAAVLAHVRVSRRNAMSIQGEICIVDAQGQVLAEVEGVRCQRIGSEPASDEMSSQLYTWRWEQAPAIEPTPVQGQHWLVVADRPALAGRLVDAARAAGLGTELVRGEALAERLARGEAPDGVLDLRAVDLNPEQDPSGEAACAALLDLAQQLIQAASPVRLIVATRGAVPVGDAAVEPAAGAVWGLGRVVMTEQPALRVKLVDLDSRDTEVGRLLAELQGGGAEDEIALRAGARHVPRLDRWRPEAAGTTERSMDEPVRLELGTPGVLDSLHWVPDRRRPPGPGEIEIRLQHTSLNFKDLMKALNMLSAAYMETTFIGEHLGMECSGTVVAVGEGVTDYAPGDPVIAIDTNGCFRSYHTVGTGYVFHKPATLDFAEAPSLIAYVTPYYALKYLAQVQPGETLLIHSASGGVGLAAIEVARWLGAKVIATAGSEAKRQFLRERGVEHVFDSRSLDFADAVLQLTEGRGVDVVLNSLAGEAARKSLAILASHGRFIEIGKKDIAAGSLLGLADFDRNLMYVAVDTDRMGAERPALFRRLNAEVIALLAEGRLRPVPAQAFPAREISDAFRTMARAQHVGKLVIDLNTGTVPTGQSRGVAVRADRSWLVTGGLGGFGLQVATWLVAQGARELVLVGRSGASRPEAQAAIEQLQAAGATVRVEAVDVADREAVVRLIRRIGESMAPLQGIVHGAMVLDDGMLETLDGQRLAAVMRPKALGAWHLHEATRSLPLEAFVMFSSVASFIGNAGQGSYVAANCFLETLAWHRRALGLPALTVNWGAISDVGVVARNEGTAAYLDNLGIGSLTSSACTRALGHLLEADAVQVGVVNMNWPRWAASAGAIVRSPRFARLVSADGGKAGEELPVVAELRPLTPEQRLDLVQERIREQLARVMHQDVTRVDVSLSLDNMGVDSLMAIELISRVRAELGVELSAMSLMMHGVTVAKLSQQVLASLFPQQAAPAEETGPAPAVPVDEMSEAELDALLAIG
ncbi:SDR family NAD(P)-dependent oxidoreductase [Aquabacterium sp. A7-Y]|uniref:SDR family NAD(P)-dependent oxidoreductase n=1 Tax=Aquabacterium sp. A7-Y TaxID=1349605 RepID=UPI00223D9948|nr:SDR family NAD(P)-dependent oxidoreductase [Aquabacterium sp. A7-Y]MCW7539505.1 SDR family NAD(P)-dependent oxidoreductase [Aquabacterium sp. A7-Y]